jgi:hypothetical protein
VNTTTCCLYTPVESRSADALGQTFSHCTAGVIRYLHRKYEFKHDFKDFLEFL